MNNPANDNGEKAMNDNQLTVGKVAAWSVGTLLVIMLIGWATSWFGLVTQRPMDKYAEETRAQVYDSSRQFQQGTNRDIARYCEQMRSSTDKAPKKALAILIRSTADTYEGRLSPDNMDCLNEAKGF